MDLAATLLRLALGRRLPVTRGERRVEGLHAPLTIKRDRYGIPTIEAQTDEDVWFGLGFCQAQDRPFQLELLLRTARGTLAELVGKSGLGIDRLVRRVGLREAAARQFEVLAPEIRSTGEAFARGINAGLRATPRPHELALLLARPTPWDAIDAVGIAKLMALVMIGNWDVELARLKILSLDGPEALQALNPTYPEEHVVVSPPGLPAGPAIDRLSADMAAFLNFAGVGGGSNNWAISGARTASGRPLVANDPHLDNTLPPHWYLAHLKTPAWDMAGAVFVGGLAVASGHNGFAAWGITAGLADTVDLFLEEPGPDGSSVRQGDAFVPCEVRRETIAVRWGKPVVEEVIVTPRGPIIGPALGDEVGAISMSAQWLLPRPARGFLAVQNTRSFDAFRHAFEQWPLLSSNVVYADEGGTIGWQLVGEAPVRRKGFGTMPQRGADPEMGWEPEPVPFESMPFAENPEAGFVATANAKPQRDGDGPYLGVDWLDGYRAGRISELLASRKDWDVTSTLRMQLDEKSLPWREVRDAVLALPAVDESVRLGLGLLRAWDGVVAVDSAAATVWELFIAEVWRRVARAKAPKSAAWALGRGFSELISFTTFAGGRQSRVLRLLREQPDGWLERGWPLELADALSMVVKRLSEEFGADPAGWNWGHRRRLVLEHPLGRLRPLVSLFNRGPYPWGGDGATISQAGSGGLRRPGTIASLRSVIDVGAWDDARFVLPGGQSGNPFSPHYDDMLPLWLKGEGVPIAWSPAAVEASTVETLRLLPQG